MSHHAFTNRLIDETSPYLLQHAHNPVDWYPWGEEALSLARSANKPIIVSIGYSACHWCHVMERESFENQDVARYMNQHFVNIKVDREERPDLDNLFMQAVQIISGHGGWPLNVFLTPQGKPFYGGTYFPPVSMYQRPSWMDVLTFISDVWARRTDEAADQAERLHKHLYDLSQLHNNKIEPSFSEAEKKKWDQAYFRKIRDDLMRNADLVYGGFGKPPKFPQLSLLNFLLTYGYFNQDEECLGHVFFSLEAMLRGGIYDHLAGGLSRYSTDEKWLVPHFEKMLYDNALLLETLSDAYRLKPEPSFRAAIIDIVSFCRNELLGQEGGYFAAIDADSEGEEGKYYVWSRKEITDILGDGADFFCRHYGVSDNGNWEGNNILHLAHSRGPKDDNVKLTESEELLLETCRKKLWLARQQRIRPSTDDKILSGWNALLLHALCKAFGALGDQSYRTMAVSLFDFLSQNMCENGILRYHNWKNGKKGFTAVSEDYACFIRACLSLQEITGNDHYLVCAAENTRYMIDHFSQENGGLFYFTSSQEKDILIRTTEIADLATPSANSVMAYNLISLSVLYDNASWKIRAEEMLANLSKSIEKQSVAMSMAANVLLLFSRGFREIVVTGNESEGLLRAVLSRFLPNGIIQSSTVEKNYPLLKNKKFGKGGFVYVCENFTCAEPVSTLTGLGKLL